MAGNGGKALGAENEPQLTAHKKGESLSPTNART